PVRLAATRCARTLASLGDMDGDGTCELAIGDPGFISENRPIGAVHLASLALDGQVSREVLLSPDVPSIGELDPPERFGTGLAALGDLDSDGTAELAIGAGDSTSAWLCLVSLDRSLKPVRVRRLLAGDSLRAPLALAALGDIDGDGRCELAVGATA